MHEISSHELGEALLRTWQPAHLYPPNLPIELAITYCNIAAVRLTGQVAQAERGRRLVGDGPVVVTVSPLPHSPYHIPPHPTVPLTPPHPT